MKEGMYVRTYKGQIYKVTEVKNDYVVTDDYGEIFSDGEESCGTTICYWNEIKKAGNTITDILEHGDYVNYERVNVVIKADEYRDGQVVCGHDGDFLYDSEIESVVSHEQFDMINYKVK